MSRYTADRIFLNSNIAPFGEMNTICWVRPDYVLQLVNIPVGVILLSNLTVIIAAVATAYRSATFRWEIINRGNIATVWKVSSRNTKHWNHVKSFFQEHNDVCEAYWGSKELCHSFRHPWTWILGWFYNSSFGLSIHFITGRVHPVQCQQLHRTLHLHHCQRAFRCEVGFFC